jgi:hypothetical protein
VIPSPTIEFEFTPGTWTTATGRLRKPAGLSITRGRENELVPISSGECSFSLQNNDGIFSQGVAGAYPVKRFVPVRVSTSGRRFTGYVDAWTVGLSQRGKLSDCQVRCVDRSTLDSLKALAAHTHEVIEQLAPLAYWDLTGEFTGTSVPGGAAAGLIPRYAGVSGGQLGWGSGEAVAADDASGVRFTPALNDTTQAMEGGYRLEAKYTPPASYSLILIYGKAEQDGPMLRMGGVRIDTQGGGAEYVPGTGARMPLTGNVEVASVNGSGVVLSSDPTRSFQTVSTAAASTQVGGTLTGTTPAWSGASVSHVAVVPYIAPGSMDAIVRRLSAAPDAVETVIGNLLSLSGAGSATVIRQGLALQVRGMSTGGQSAQAIIDQLAGGSLGRYHVDRNGAPTWLSYDYAPAAVSQPADAGVLPSLIYEVDVSAWVSDVTTSLPSGGSWTASDATGLARASLDVQHALPTDAEARAVASTIVYRSNELPRLKGVTFDLLRLASGQVATLLALDIGHLLTLTNLPPQVPSPQTVVVEGIAETLTEASWQLSLTTSPAPSFDWFAWGDAWGSKPWKPF